MKGSHRIPFWNWIIALHHHDHTTVGSVLIGRPVIGVGFGLAILLNPLNAMVGGGLWLAIMYYIYRHQRSL